MAVPVCGRSGLWPVCGRFRIVAASVCGLFGVWPFSVCGRFGLWPFQCMAVSVCGRFGLCPFRFWPFRFVAVMTRNQTHIARIVLGLYSFVLSWTSMLWGTDSTRQWNAKKTHSRRITVAWQKREIKRYIELCMVSVSVICRKIKNNRLFVIHKQPNLF